MEGNNTSPKSIDNYMKRVPSSAIVEHGPGATFHSMEVP
jgi:hypothetical protein